MCSADRVPTLTVKKAMDILDCLGSAGNRVTCGEISERLEMPRSTTYRLLSTLAACGYVVAEHDDHGTEYRLGFKILELASRLLDGMELRHRALPLLKRLRDVSEETVHLVVEDRGEVTYIEKVDSLKTVRMHSAVGRRGFMHSTAVGKAILAYRLDEVDAVIGENGLPALTENTITDREGLLEELKTVRSLGYAVDDGENEDGIRCIAAPIFNHQGRVVAALSASGPAFRLSLDRLRELSGVVKSTGVEISRQLGYVG